MDKLKKIKSILGNIDYYKKVYPSNTKKIELLRSELKKLVVKC